MMFAPAMINLVAFKVNTIDRSSFSLGASQQFDVFLSTKRNQGFGQQSGDAAAIFVPLVALNDMDYSDSNSVKTSLI